MRTNRINSMAGFLWEGRTIGFRYQGGAPGGFGLTGAQKMNIGMAVVGKGFAAYSAYRAGSEEAKGYKRKAEQAILSAAEVLKRDKYEGWRSNIAARHEQGTQRAQYAALGLEIQGTAIENLAAAARELTLEKLMATHNAKLQQAGYMAEAREYKRAAKAAKKSGTLNAITSFLS